MASASSARRQPKRQPLRTSTTRPANYYARNFGTVEAEQPAQESEPGFFPAIQHFTDCAYALPKEVTSHIAMLKEVEAKVHVPEQGLWELFDKVSDLPPAQHYQPTGHTAAQSLAGSANGSVYNETTSPSRGTHLGREIQSSQPQARMEGLQRDELNRRELCKAVYHTINWMNPILDEKIAVLHTANEALRMQLERMQSSYSHIDNEISEEARIGSTTHWAFVQRADVKKPSVTNERPRREGVRALAEAAEADLAASRSEARREAMLAKKQRTQTIDSDFDDRPASKKQHGSKLKKPNFDADRAVGLGITSTASVPKKRKLAQLHDKSQTVALPQMKSVGMSPHETSIPDFSLAKRKKPGPPPGSKKRSQQINSSPALQPSELYPIPPVAVARPNANRARQNSQSNVHNAATAKSNQNNSSAKRSSVAGTAATKKHLSTSASADDSVGPDAAAIRNGTYHVDSGSVPDARGHDEKQTNDTDPTAAARGGKGSKACTPAWSAHSYEPGGKSRNGKSGTNGISHGADIGAQSVSNGRKGHTRNAESISGTPANSSQKAKHRHNSIAGDGGSDLPLSMSGAVNGDAEVAQRSSSRPQRARRVAQAMREDEAVDMGQSDEEAAGATGEEDEDDERTYCFCGEAGTGTMVGCDNDDCRWQWLHLTCVGLSQAPAENEQWYCPDCRQLLGLPA